MTSFYDNPELITYQMTGATVTSAATLLTVRGPAGKRGRVTSMAAVVTTATTGAATEIRVGNSGDADAHGTLSIPVASAGVGANTFVAPTDRELEIAADEDLLIATDGGSTLGAANIYVAIAWY